MYKMCRINQEVYDKYPTAPLPSSADISLLGCTFLLSLLIVAKFKYFDSSVLVNFSFDFSQVKCAIYKNSNRHSCFLFCQDDNSLQWAKSDKITLNKRRLMVDI